MAVTQAWGESWAPALYPAPQFAVFVKPTWASSWEWVPYLYPVSAHERTSPSIGWAEFRYEFGNIKREDATTYAVYSPNMLDGYFIAIHAFDGWGEKRLWIGVVQEEVAELYGTSTYPSGIQQFRAVGLEYILDRFTITGSWTDDGLIDRPLIFNSRKSRGHRKTGNRSSSVDGTYGVYTFSTDNEEWTNRDIVRHILGVHANAVSDLTFTTSGLTGAINDIVEIQSLHGMTVKRALDKLIDRHRGLGWRILTTGSGNLHVDIFSTLSDPISVGDYVIPANQDQYIINLEGVIDAHGIFHFSDLAAYDTILVQGGPIYACASFSIADGTLEEGWTSTEEDEYRECTESSGSDAQDYDRYRNADEFARVFRYLRVPPTWGFTANNGQDSGTDTIVCPILLDDGTFDYTTSASTYYPGLVFERELPFAETVNVENGESEYRKALWVVKDQDGTHWQFAERYTFQETMYPVGITVSDSELGVRLHIPHGHLVALNHWDSPADSEVDPVMDYEQGILTAMFATDQRLFVRTSLGYPLVADAPREKVIHVPDAVAWYVLPGTVIDIDDGALSRYDGAGEDDNWERDDSDRLRSIAAFAAAWYGQSKATASLQIRQITLMHPAGSMIRGAYGSWHSIEVNTTVTARDWDFVNMTTNIQTGFDELRVDRSAQTFLPTVATSSAYSGQDIGSIPAATGRPITQGTIDWLEQNNMPLLASAARRAGTGRHKASWQDDVEGNAALYEAQEAAQEAIKNMPPFMVPWFGGGVL